jgi:hypothetical protein
MRLCESGILIFDLNKQLLKILKMEDSMETQKTPNRFIIWLKNNFIFIIILVLLIIFIDYKLNLYESTMSDSIILPNANLDFQNASGVTRVKSSFADILIGSEGSSKKGDGYEVKLKIINPSSITLQNIKCEFKYNSFKNPVIYENVNTTISPGTSKILTCFISDLSDYDLKSINVSVHFDQIMFIK